MWEHCVGFWGILFFGSGPVPKWAANCGPTLSRSDARDGCF